MIINVTFDQPQSSLPAGFVSAVDYVVNYYDSVFTNAVTINIDVGYGEIDGDPLGSGDIGESQATGINQFAYSTVISALNANATAADQQSAYATLPPSTPLHGGTLWIAPAEQKALGLMPANATDIDGYVGFSNTVPFSYSVTAAPGHNQYYFIGDVEHEISEVMGRVSYIGDDIGGTDSYSIMDLFRWEGSGTRQLTTSGPAYFSIDGGVTDLDNWNTDPSGDLGDWSKTAGNDAYLAFVSAGTIDPVTAVDLEDMNVIGWDPMLPVASGTVYVSSGQTSNGVTVLGSGALATLSGGTAIGTNVSAGAADYVEAGGTASATILSSGGDEFVEAGGMASGTVVGGGSQVVYGTASGTVLNSAGSYQYLESGIAVATVVSSGVEVVYGTATGTVDHSGGFDFVFSGGTALSTVISGGEEYIEIGASAIGTVLDGSAQIVYGTAASTTINSGGFLYLEPGGSASATVVRKGVDVIYGVAAATIVSSGGDDYVESGGTADATTLSGGVEFVEIAAITIGATANGGTQVVYGTADSTTLNQNAFQYVEPGGSASGTLVNSGVVVVYGAASATVLHSGGFDYVEGGGSGSGTVVGGGVEYVEVGGTAANTVVSGGAQVVYGTAIAAAIAGGSFQYVSLGGVASGTQVLGGYEYVLPGGIVSGATLSGGTLEMTSGAIDGAAAIAFAMSGGGTLRLDDSRDFAGTIAGFGLPDQIDLSDIAFGAGTMVSFQEAAGNASGTLTVASGAEAANLTLLGQYVAAQFHIASDGHGGTLVTDPPLPAVAEPRGYLLATDRFT